jgi:hypothetical protein
MMSPYCDSSASLSRFFCEGVELACIAMTDEAERMRIGWRNDVQENDEQSAVEVILATKPYN